MKQWTKIGAMCVAIVVCVTTIGCSRNCVGKSAATNGTVYTGAFYNSDIALAVGEMGETLYSYDKGKTWTPGENNSRCLFTLDMIDQNTCFATGHGADVVVTTDSGKTWSHCTDIGCELGKQLSFIDRENGWAAGWAWLGVTHDGCQTWTKITQPKKVVVIESIAMTGMESGLLLANTGFLYQTNDNGATWNEVTQIFSKKDTSFTYTAGQMNATAAMRVIGDKGLCICAGLAGTKCAILVYSSKDGGNTWTKEDFLYTEKPTLSVSISRDFIVSAFDIGTTVTSWQF